MGWDGVFFFTLRANTGINDFVLLTTNFHTMRVFLFSFSRRTMYILYISSLSVSLSTCTSLSGMNLVFHLLFIVFKYKRPNVRPIQQAPLNKKVIHDFPPLKRQFVIISFSGLFKKKSPPWIPSHAKLVHGLFPDLPHTALSPHNFFFSWGGNSIKFL